MAMLAALGLVAAVICADGFLVFDWGGYVLNIGWAVCAILAVAVATAQLQMIVAQRMIRAAVQSARQTL